jgi:hypothetical protein
MNDMQRLNRIQSDLRQAPHVLYCEGKTDPEALFALLGKVAPRGNVVGNCFVVGLRDGGSGSAEVNALVRVARANGLNTVWGVTDGDGQPWSRLQAHSIHQRGGPVFTWPCYCIENLIARAAWPANWDPSPNWQSDLSAYAPYAALNRVHRDIQSALETLKLHKFRVPASGADLLTFTDVEDALKADASRLNQRAVDEDFAKEYAAVVALIRQSDDEGHCVMNGKWLVTDLASRKTGKIADLCRREWIEAVRTAGGDRDVITWWKRFTNETP